MRSDTKLRLAAATCALGALLAFAGLLKAGPVPCDAQANFAYANTPTPTAEYAFASVGPDFVPSNPLGLFWRDFGTEYRLIEPGRCHGTFCTPDRVVGGWNGQYRTWDGKRWGPVSQPPIAPPETPRVQNRPPRWTFEDAAAVLAAGLIGLVEQPCNDCPNGRCPAPTSSSQTPFSGGGVAVASGGERGATFSVAKRRPGLIRRLLTAPFRAFRAMRARSAPAESFPVAEACPPTSGAALKAHSLQPAAKNALQPKVT